jgi:hypothetical protein
MQKHTNASLPTHYHLASTHGFLFSSRHDCSSRQALLLDHHHDKRTTPTLTLNTAEDDLSEHEWLPSYLPTFLDPRLQATPSTAAPPPLLTLTAVLLTSRKYSDKGTFSRPISFGINRFSIEVKAI